MTLGDKIKKLRKQKGWSQSQLASQIGRAQNTISGIEKGGGTDSETIKLLAAALNVSISYLIDENIDVDDNSGIEETKEFEFALKLVRAAMNELKSPEDLTKDKMEYIEAILKKAISDKYKKEES